MPVLGLDTSNYTTSAAVFDGQNGWNEGRLLEVRPGERTVTVEGRRVALTYKEFELLLLLMRSPGMVFTREQLMTRVWGTDYLGESRTVDMHVRTLRQKLGVCGGMIETVRNVGYRMEKET